MNDARALAISEVVGGIWTQRSHVQAVKRVLPGLKRLCHVCSIGLLSMPTRGANRGARVESLGRVSFSSREGLEDKGGQTNRWSLDGAVRVALLKRAVLTGML